MTKLNEDDLFSLYLEYSNDILPTVSEDDVKDWNNVVESKDEAKEWIRIGILNPFHVANFKRYKITPEELIKVSYSGSTYIESFLSGEKTIYDLVRELKSKKKDDNDDGLITV
jgi:hypothetical protein